jgi:alpha-2-macroglobulin
MNRRTLRLLLLSIAMASLPCATSRELRAASVPQPVQVIHYEPTGEAGSAVRQIKVRFSRPMGYFEQGQVQAPRRLLNIAPSIEGRLFWQATDLLVFESDAPLPLATLFDVWLAPDLKSSDGGEVGNPPSWRFETARPVCTPAPLPDDRHGWLGPYDAMLVECQQEPVLTSVRGAVSVSVGGRPWLVDIARAEGNQRGFLVKPYIGHMEPLRREVGKGQWRSGQTVELVVGPGILGENGPLPSKVSTRMTFTVAPKPAAIDVTCKRGLVLRMATPLGNKGWRQVRISPEPGGDRGEPQWRAEQTGPQGITVWRAELPLPMPGTLYTVTIPERTEDIYEQRMESGWRREVLCPLPKERQILKLGRPDEPLVGSFEASKPRTTILRSKGVEQARLDYVALEPSAQSPDAIRTLRVWASPAKEPDDSDMDSDEADSDEAPVKRAKPPSPPPRAPAFERSRALAIVAEPAQPLDRTILDLGDLPKGKLVAARVVGASKHPDDEGRALLQVTDVGLFGWLTRGRGAVSAVHLSTGQPWPEVSVLAGHGKGPWVKIGTTDQRGWASVASPFTEVGAILARDAQQTDGVACLVDDAPPAPVDASDGQPTLLGRLVMDRSLFAPGDVIHFSGFAAVGMPSGAERALPAGTKMRIELTDEPAGEDGADAPARPRPARGPAVEVALDARGKLWGELHLPKETRLGMGSLRARLRGKDVDEALRRADLSAEVEVADFRLAEVAVKARMSAEHLGPDQIPRLLVDARRFSGERANLRSASVVRRCWPSGAQDLGGGWSMGPGGDTNAMPVTDYLQVEERDLPTGHFELDIPSLPLDPLRRTRCSLDVSVSDQAQRWETTKLAYTLYPARFGLAVKLDSITGGQGLRVALQALDPQERRVAVPEVLVHVRDFHSLALLKSLRVQLAAAGPARVIEIPELPEGRYIVSAEAYDGVRPVRSEVEQYLSEREAPSPSPADKRQPVRAKADKNEASEKDDEDGQDGDLAKLILPATGKVGETITVEVRASRRARTGLLAFARGEIQDAVPLRFEHGRARVRVQVKDAWFPEVELQAFIALPGGRGEGQQVSAQAKLQFASGESLQVTREHRDLAVAIRGPAESSPGAEVAYQVSVRDQAGRPVPSARISAWVVDESMLALRDYQVPDLVAAFAFSPPSHIVDIDSFADLIAPFRETELDNMAGPSGYGRGAGGLGGRRVRAPDFLSPVVYPRSRFPTTPFFLGDAPTDGRGEARFGFRLPENLTRYRITVVAAAPWQDQGPYLRFGKEERSLRVSRPLSLRPTLPKFLRPGDRSEVSVAVLSPEAAAGPAEVTLAVEAPAGGAPPVAVEGESRRRVSLAAGREQHLAFTLKARAAGRAELVLSARQGHDGTGLDVVRVPIVVEPEPAPRDQHFAAGGILAGGSKASIPLALSQAAGRTDGSLRLRVLRRLEDDLEGALAYLDSYHDLSAEQSASTLVPLLLFARHSRASGEVAERIKARLARLDGFKIRSQRAADEGGMDFWPGSQEPDLFSTAWALLVLAHAPPEAGVKARVESLARATANLLARPATDLQWSQAARALGYFALAKAKQKGPAAKAPAPDYEPIPTAFSALAHTLAAQGAPAAIEAARRWLSEAILRLPEEEGMLHAARAGGYYHDLPGHHCQVAELALAWALARVWPDHPARTKIMRALATHWEEGRFSNSFENALFLMLAAEATPPGPGQGSIEGSAEGVPWLPASPWPAPGQVLERSWLLATLPAAFFAVESEARFLLRATGKGEVFYSLEARLPPEDRSLPVEHGLAVATHLRGLGAKHGESARVIAGEVVALDIQVNADSSEGSVVIDLPLPAGLEAIRPDIPADRLTPDAQPAAHHDFASAHIELRPERVLIVPRHLVPGISRHTLFLRALLAGTYRMPAPRAEVMYAPERYGRGRDTRVTVLPGPSPRPAG